MHEGVGVGLEGLLLGLMGSFNPPPLGPEAVLLSPWGCIAGGRISPWGRIAEEGPCAQGRRVNASGRG